MTISESHADSPGANGTRAPVSLAHHHRVAPPAGATTSADVWTALDKLGITMPITNPA